MKELYTLLFIAIAGICNSVMDTLAYHYDQSIFTNPIFNQQFCNPKLSWQNKYTQWIPDTFTDLWHLSKSGMLNFLSIAITLHIPIALIGTIWDVLINFIIVRFAFGIPFVLFYNKLLLKKKV